MRSGWVTRTYTYTEPIDPADDGPDAEYGANAKRKSGVTGPDTYSDTIGNTSNRPEFDAGFNAGYRSGWNAGYEAARHSNEAVDHAWAAGFIDGEGSIMVGMPSDRKPTYFLLLTVTQKRIEPLDKLVSIYGGNIRVRTDGLYIWRISHKKAADALHKMRPYLTFKSDQADIAFEFQDTILPRGKRYTSSNRERQAQLAEQLRKAKVT